MLNSLLADPWLLASAIAQLFLLVLGLVVTLQEEWAKKHKWILIGAFVVFGGIAFVATMIQGRSSAKAATDLAVSLQKLSAASIETQRQTALNTKLQGQLVSQSNTITDLANRNIASVTGGDSFCYADFMGTADQVQQEVLQRVS